VKTTGICFLFLSTLLLSLQGLAQQAVFEGVVMNVESEPMEFVNVSIRGYAGGTTTGPDGHFSLPVPATSQTEVMFSFVGYQTTVVSLFLAAGERKVMNITLITEATDLPDVEVRDRQLLTTGIIRLDPKLTLLLPGPSASVEALIKTLPGVSSTTELSSQYNVRGGNFDENLVYVNGIEIYRPFLIRSGQQEGLSFINPEMVADISFSAGGFEASYGDKMASVLDIRYKQPEKLAGSFSISLLEGSLHLENRSENEKFSFLAGGRYKSNQYLLGTLPEKGAYRPSFSDFQGLFAYQFNDRLKLSFLGNYSFNSFQFEPEIQRTRFGTLTDVRELTVYFDGQEVDQFITTMGSLSLEASPSDRLALRFTASVFQSDEREQFDILGQYWLYRVETDFGQDDFGQPTGTALGVGTFLKHARNYLNAIVWNAEHQGHMQHEGGQLRWGMRFQHEDIFDRLKEWTLIDSSGYALPQAPSDAILMQDTLDTRISLVSNRLSGFIQNTWEKDVSHGRFAFTAGFRLNYWDFNRQLLFSPRASMLYKPLWASRWVFRASAGYYHQPPFYRELRDFQGRLNEDIKAQESIHLVLGSEYNFQAWDRPFKYTAEVYYKHLKHLIPYELDNVRIRYYADNSAEGYATGLDMKIHGEFVPGVESWMSLSIMQTKEQIEGAYYTDALGRQTPAGFIPRPTDQRFSFSMFFQDFLPRNPSYQVQIGFFYGTGLPFGPPTLERQKDTLRMPSYKRVDIGFSKQLIGQESRFSDTSPLRHINSMWITAEIFNLLEINNTISYLWIKDVENRLFAVPNHLTSRLINIKLITRF
jgi:hypothetical protein